jgi:excisionase family DNA binding protein
MTTAPAIDTSTLRAALADESGDRIDVHLTLPRETAELVLRLIEAQQRGNAIVLPAREEYTPNEVAAILGISRPQVYKLIDVGRLAHRMVGTHRRIPAGSVTAFQADQHTRQQQAMAELARLSNDLGWVE